MHSGVYGFVRTYEAREEKSNADPTHCQINTCKTTQKIRSSKQSQSTRKLCVGFLTGLCIDKERVRLESPRIKEHVGDDQGHSHYEDLSHCQRLRDEGHGVGVENLFCVGDWRRE